MTGLTRATPVNTRRVLLSALAACMVACGAPSSSPPPAPRPTEVSTNPTPSAEVLAPSPLQLAEQVRAAKLGALVVPTGLPTLDSTRSKDQIAFDLGVLFAHTLLGAKTFPRRPFWRSSRV